MSGTEPLPTMLDDKWISLMNFQSLQFMSSVYFYGHIIYIGWLLMYYTGLGGVAKRGLGGGANGGLGGGAKGEEDKSKEE